MKLRRPTNRALAAALILLTGGSIAANLLLLRSLETAFVKLQFARIFPLGFVDSSDAVTARRSHGSLIMVYGDSRALMWRKLSLAAPPGYEIANMAHGGQTSRQVLLQILSAPPEHSNWAVLQVGINDLHAIGELGVDHKLIVESLINNIRAATDLLLQRSDYVIVSTIVQPGPIPLIRRLSWDDHTRDYVALANRTIRSWSGQARVFVLDADRLLSGQNSILGEQYADRDFFLHFNNAAYDVLNSEIRKIIAAVPSQTPG